MKFHALYVAGPLSFGLGANVFALTAKETQACNERASSYSQVSSLQQDFEAGEELMKNGCSDHAVQLWEKAAKGHHARAIFMLGLIYQGGDTGTGNTRANPRKAFPYFKEAADLGDVDAMYMLGLHYEDGTLFLKKDIKAAWGWYVNAAEKGHALAIQRLVKAYRQGELGQAVSPEQADYWNGRLSINN